MNILIVGSGARESAFIWKLNQSKKDIKLFSINPNAGAAELSTPIYTEKEDLEFIKSQVVEHKIDMVLVGPEIPLINGIQDFLKNDPSTKKTSVIGPSKKGAQLEGSKDFAKNFMAKYNIPTASYKSFSQAEIQECLKYLDTINPPYVLKADGPAAGKGVLIIEELDEAKTQLKDMLLGKFGESSKTVVIEEFLDGIEMSCFVLFDGKNYKVLPYAKDYKRITTNVLQEMKENNEKISMLSSYDFTLAKIVDNAGIDVILVGDSASNVMAGHETTLPITLDHMIYHAISVVKAASRALVVVDLPFGSYQGDSKKALRSSIRIMKESGAHAVKLEGGDEIIDSVQ